MQRKVKLGIVSLLSVIAILFSAMPASAVGTAMVQLLQDVSPKGGVSVRVGQKVALRALAASGSTVTAEINGQTVVLSATSEKEDSAFWYEGIYTVPKAAEGTSLGEIRFTAKLGGRSESRTGGALSIAEKNVTVVVDPPADSNIEPVSGDMVVVKPDYADIFSSVDRGEDYAAPYYFNLPKGTIDYVVGSTSASYILKSGRRIAKTNVTSLGSGTKGNNTVSGNNFDGQFCVHFRNSKTHGTDRVDTDVGGHQDKIKAGAAALEGKLSSDGVTKIDVKSTYP